MRQGWWIAVAGLVGLASLLGACQSSTSASGSYACGETGECPSGLMCVDDRCVDETGAADASGEGPDGGGGGDPDGGGGGPDGGGGVPDAADPCYLEESFTGALATDTWDVETVGLATQSTTGGTLDLTGIGTTGDALVRVFTDDGSHDYRGETVTLATPSLPNTTAGDFFFRLRYRDRGDITTIGFKFGNLIEALGECPSCADEFCDELLDGEPSDFQFLRISVDTDFTTTLEFSDDGTTWTLAMICSERTRGLDSARLEIGLTADSSVTTVTATVDDLTVCPTP